MKTMLLDYNQIRSTYYNNFINKIIAPKFEEIFDPNFEQFTYLYWDSIKGNEVVNQKAQDEFFANFTIFWRIYLDIKDYRNGHKLWEYLFNLSKKWEDKNKRYKLHKGSLFYFWGANYLFEDDIDEAYILIHQAVKEDIRSQNNKTKRPNAPAYWFVSLNKDKEQFLGNYIQNQVKFIEDSLNNYNLKNTRNFNFKIFKSKFLDGSYVEEVTLFSYIISKYLELSSTQLRLFRNKFTNLIFISILFDLTLIIEKLLKIKFRKTIMCPLIVELSKKNKLSIVSDVQQLMKKIETNGFDKILKNIINHRYLLPSKNSLSNIEENIYITYSIRNHRAHNVKSLEVISKEHNTFFEAILHTLFYVIDSLY